MRECAERVGHPDATNQLGLSLVGVPQQQVGGLAR